MGRESCSHGWPVPSPWGSIWGCAESSWYPWKRTYLQEYPLLPTASGEYGWQLLVPLPASLARAFSSSLSHFKAFLRAACNWEPGGCFSSTGLWAGQPLLLLAGLGLAGMCKEQGMAGVV